MVAILLIGEDPGGVDVIVPIKKRLDTLGVASRVLSSGPGNAVWQRHGIPFEDITLAVADPIDSVKTRLLLESENPKAIVTATSFPRRVEKIFRHEARRLGVPSIMVLDADRADLYRTEPEELACRPDIVVSIGRRMTSQLIAAKYHDAQIITAGHLALDDIAVAGRSIPEAEVSAWKRRFMQTIDGRELIVIFSDNIAQVYGEAGAVEEIGYHERMAVPALLRAIAVAARRSNRRYELVVKLHPKELPGTFDIVYRELHGDQLHLREEGASDNLRLIRAADHIFGMFSIVMVWSALIGRTTLSYQPNARRRNLLITAEDQAVPCCWHEAELEQMVEAFLSDTQWLAEWRRRLAAWHPGLSAGLASVTDRILRMGGLD